MVIYLDESGDLGFDFSKRGATQYFVITILVCKSRKTVAAIRKAIIRTRRNKLGKNIQEMKGANTALNVKKYFLKNIKNDDCEIYTVILNKKRVTPELRTKIGQKKLYNFLSRILIDEIKFSDNVSTLTLVVDKMKNKHEIKDFNQYIENQLESRLPLNCLFYIYHQDSCEDTGIQAVDMFCWGIARKYMRKDDRWYNCYKKKIKDEILYLP